MHQFALFLLLVSVAGLVVSVLGTIPRGFRRTASRGVIWSIAICIASFGLNALAWQADSAPTPTHATNTLGQEILIVNVRTIACQDQADLDNIDRAIKENDVVTETALEIEKCDIVEAGEQVALDGVDMFGGKTRVRHRGQMGVMSSLWMWSYTLK